MIGVVSASAFFLAFYLIGLDVASALLLTLVIFAHELGHAAALWWYRLGVSRMIFLPFLGAVTLPHYLFRTEKERFYVYFAGPLAGIMTCLVLMAVLPRGKEWVLAYGLLVVNWLNMWTIPYLDGWHMITACVMSFLKNRYGAEVPYNIARKWVVLTTVINYVLIYLVTDFLAYVMGYRALVLNMLMYGLPVALLLEIWRSLDALKMCYYPEKKPKAVEKLRRKGMPVINLMWLEPMSEEEAKRCLIAYYLLFSLTFLVIASIAIYAYYMSMRE